jgi:hypothetical protein
MVAQSAEFKKAVEDSRSLTKTPTNDELLEVCNHIPKTGRSELSTGFTVFTWLTTPTWLIAFAWFASLTFADNNCDAVDLCSLQTGQRRG